MKTSNIIFISLGLLILLVSYYLADKHVKAEIAILDKEPFLNQNAIKNYNMNGKRVTYTLLYSILSIFVLYLSVFAGLVVFFLIRKVAKTARKIKDSKKSKKANFNM